MLGQGRAWGMCLAGIAAACPQYQGPLAPEGIHGGRGHGSSPAVFPQGSKRKRGAKAQGTGSTGPGTQLSLRAFLRPPTAP